MTDEHRDCRCRYRPSPEEVADLIARAKRDELGIGFLVNGSLGSVAAHFRVHAFAVDAARRELATVEEEPGESG